MSCSTLKFGKQVIETLTMFKGFLHFVDKTCSIVDTILKLLKELSRLPEKTQVFLYELEKCHNTVIAVRNSCVRACKCMSQYAFNSGLSDNTDHKRFREICHGLCRVYILDSNAALHHFDGALTAFDNKAIEMIEQATPVRNSRIKDTAIGSSFTAASGVLGIASIALLTSGIFTPLGVTLGLVAFPAIAVSGIATGVTGHALHGINEVEKQLNRMRDGALKLQKSTEQLKERVKDINTYCALRQPAETMDIFEFKTTVASIIAALKSIDDMEVNGNIL